MIYRNLKRGSYCIAWLISMLLVAPLLGYALIFILAAMALVRSRDIPVLSRDPGVGGQLFRWVNGWKAADRYLQWVAKFTGIYH